MPINSGDPLVCAGLEKLGCDDFLDSEDDTVFATDADGGAAVLDCFDSILDLKVSAIGGEDGVGEIVACSYGSLGRRSRVSS